MHSTLNTPLVRAVPGSPLNSFSHVAVRHVREGGRSPHSRGCSSFDPQGACGFIRVASPRQSSCRKTAGSVQTKAAAAAAAAAPVLGIGVQWVLAVSACVASLSFAFFVVAALPTLLVGA